MRETEKGWGKGSLDVSLCLADGISSGDWSPPEQEGEREKEKREREKRRKEKGVSYLGVVRSHDGYVLR